MTEEFKQMVIDALRRGDELPREWVTHLFPPAKQEYELVYYAKEREEEIIASTMGLPLQPVSTFGSSGNDWYNKLIFGDNLQAMKTLLKMKEEGKLHNADGTDGFRLIYIDPPFATKKEFRGSQEQKAYQDKIAGAEFIEFIRKRLVFLKRLISSDGNIVVHLDNRKIHYVKIILDELLGEHNFVNEIVWNKGREGGSSRSHSQSSAMPTEYQNLLIYARERGKRFWKPLLGPYKKSTVSRIEKDKKGWFYTRGRMGRQPADWEIEAGVSLKTYVSNDVEKTKDEIINQITAPTAEFVALGDVWNSELVKLTTCTDYPTEKPESLLNLVLKAATKDGDLVLDCFAGSGTTLAVAEKMQRRWVGIDCGKLSIYTIQKRMLNLRSEIGNYGKPLKPKAFTVYNAGLYDFSSLTTLSWSEWRFFALQLFGCKDEPHTIGGLSLDGKLKGASVLVFNHVAQPGRRIDQETIEDIHLAVGKRIGRKFFIIAPRGVFDFQQDYIDLDEIRYYALRIPYSVINELHQRNFTALQQPNDESAVNETVDAVGFDFIQPPQVQWNVSVKKRKGEMFDEACLKIKRFESRARIRGKDTLGSLETMSMLMVDFDYDGKVFDIDEVFYAHELEADEWQAWFPAKKVGEKLMAVFIDIYGNEARELITRDKLGMRSKKSFKAKKKLRK